MGPSRASSTARIPGPTRHARALSRSRRALHHDNSPRERDRCPRAPKPLRNHRASSAPPSASNDRRKYDRDPENASRFRGDERRQGAVVRRQTSSSRSELRPRAQPCATGAGLAVTRRTPHRPWASAHGAVHLRPPHVHVGFGEIQIADIARRPRTTDNAGALGPGRAFVHRRRTGRIAAESARRRSKTDYRKGAGSPAGVSLVPRRRPERSTAPVGSRSSKEGGARAIQAEKEIVSFARATGQPSTS